MDDLLANNAIYRGVYTSVVNALGAEWAWLAYLLGALAIVMLIVNAFLAIGTLYTWAERKLIGRFQSRLGPNRAGPFGLLQAIADAIKILTKEDIVPRRADRLIFNAAPVVMLAPSLLALAVIPFGKNSFLADLNVGVLYIVAVSGIASLSVFMAGYASANRYALFGAMRAAAMLVSYEIPLVMTLLATTVLAGSMSLVDVVEAQSIPYLIVTPLGVVLFGIAISAELNRAPFDLSEGESELVSGYLTEYSGMKFGTFYLAEFANVILAGAVFATLFLGGWRWPWLPGNEALAMVVSYAWFLAKVSLFAFVATWVRATLPRLRIDQVLCLAWKALFPMSLVNLLAVAIEVLIWPDPTAAQLWLMAVINWPLAIVAVVVCSKVVSLRSAAPVRILSASPRHDLQSEVR